LATSLPSAAIPLPTIHGLVPAGPPGTTFAGDSTALDALALVAALERGLAPATAARVVAVDVAADGQLTATVTPSITVRVGPPDSLDAKVVALGTLLDRADLKGVSTIDVRVPEDPVLTRPGGAGTVSTTPRG
jgi:Cell division protein FtsQ